MTDTWKQIDKSNVERVIKDEKNNIQLTPSTRRTDAEIKKNEALPSSSLQQQPVEKNDASNYQHQKENANNLPNNYVDIRVKLGSAAEAEKIEINGDTTTDNFGSNSSNKQVELALSPASDSAVGFVLGWGIFNRKHSGKFYDLGPATTMDYEVTGISVAPGIRILASDNFKFELKLELGWGGAGQLTLETPGYVWNYIDTGEYTSESLIAGWYYTFSKPGLQLGLEIGAQSFQGGFKILNNSGQWVDGTVKGSLGTANIVFGLSF